MSAEIAGSPSRAFVDTNIFLYAFDTTAGEKRERAKALLEELWASRSGCVSVQVLQEFYVNSTRKLPQPLEEQKAKQIIASLRRWHVHAPGADDVLEAIDLQGEAQLSFWDAMILQSASRLGCTTLWSEDLNDDQVLRGVRIRNPFRV